MTTKLSQELLDEIAQHPRQAVPLVDEGTGKTYYVCDEEFLFGSGADEQARQRLKSMIEEGLASADVPQAEAEARIQKTLDEIADKNA